MLSDNEPSSPHYYLRVCRRPPLARRSLREAGALSRSGTRALPDTPTSTGRYGSDRVHEPGHHRLRSFPYVHGLNHEARNPGQGGRSHQSIMPISRRQAVVMSCGHLPEFTRRYIRRRSDSGLHPAAPQSAARPWWLPARLICTSVPKVPPGKEANWCGQCRKRLLPGLPSLRTVRCVVQQNVRTVEIKKMR